MAITENRSRRDLLRVTAAGAATAALANSTLAQQSGSTGVPTRRLGRTDEQVSILCLGGGHIASVASKDRPQAIRIMHAAVDEGVTFFDSAWEYSGGLSEQVIGEALMNNRRDKVFLMTKNCERNYAGSMRCLEDSLRRLRTDYIDLWQFHEINYDNDPDWVFEEGGIKAAVEAKKAGKIKYIGFTGHKDPRIHLKMLGMPYDWDTSQMPINVMDAHYRSFQHRVVPVCQEKDVGVIGMKSLGGGYGIIPSNTNLTAEECLRYALSTHLSTLVVGFTSMPQLKEAVAIARDFHPLSEAMKQELLARAKPDATDGRYEKSKSTQVFDSIHHRRQHGFET